MSFGELSAHQLRRAVVTSLRLAYPEGTEIPANRQMFVGLPESMSLEEFLASVKAQSLPADGANSSSGGYALRIGNAWYPHMKLLVRPYPGPPGFVLSVDTHDKLPLPADHPEAAQFRALQERNKELARSIESAWEEEGLPTQQGLLRQYIGKVRQ